MSDLSDIVPPFDAEALPGHILSTPRLTEIAAAERYFVRRHLARVGRACRSYHADAAAKLIELAEQRVATEYFSVGMPGFVAAAMSADAAAYLLYLSLRVKHEQVTPAKAAELYRDGNEPRITAALFSLWGIVPEPGTKKKTRGPRARSPSPSTGPRSTESSAPPPTAADAA